MKKQLISLVTLMLVILLGACEDDFLERYPRSQISPQSFFNNASDLELYTNSFYDYLPGTSIYMDDISSDNVVQVTINDLVAGRRFVDTDAGSAGWTWSALYNINYFLEHYDKAQETAEVKNHYASIARFFRALFYFEKVKRFGDVPWYGKSLTDNSEELYKARDPRTQIIDSVMADLDFAIAHMNDSKNVSRITKWAALALKSRVGLFEGTYRKYHSELGLQGVSELLQQSADASSIIINSGVYGLYSTGNPNSDYLNLFASEDANTTEYILAQVYDREINKATPLNQVFTSPTRGAPGLTKSIIDSYLMKDGSRITSLPRYPEIPFSEETLDRDPRLSQTIRTPGYTRIDGTVTLVPDFANAPSGYQNVKFVTTPDRDGGGNTNDLPIFRYAEVLLNYAEAKAELGELSQADVDISINKLRDRVDMPHLQLAGLFADPLLQNQYINTSDPAILEVRRERRIELAMEGFRYFDLMRWKEGHLLADIFEGAYFPGTGTYDLDNDGEDDLALVDDPANTVDGVQNVVLGPDRALSEGNKGNLIVHPGLTKEFDESKHYLFPLPINELLLNQNLEQNPGWISQ